MAPNPCSRIRTQQPRLMPLLIPLAALGLLVGGTGGAGWAQAVPIQQGAGGVSPLTVTTAGAKGAQVYCFMRSAGNSHDVSWTAAYSLIKRQSANLFKTSPEHAAVMITEAVVQNPGAYPDCGRFLGSLFEKAAARDAAAAAAAAGDNGTSSGAAQPSKGTADRPATGSSRYSY